MKKRILLSLVSFFTMTAMWATLNDNFKLYFAENLEAGKVGQKATLVLNMKNTTERPIAKWTGKIVLPEGVTYVDGSAVVVPGRYPSNYNAQLTINGDLVLTCEGAEGVAIDGTDGAVASIQVEIASTVAPGDVVLKVENVVLTEPNDHMINLSASETPWTIEEGSTGLLGDFNLDGKIDAADLEYIYTLIAGEMYAADADFNNDGSVDAADAEFILAIIAGE
ncbi:MAG: dockerin type I repeat-containing protein [Bacteroidaceae bacterium]|nr:dockerin type I repeat-containing protein [Bacteroidaceae bacterium]